MGQHTQYFNVMVSSPKESKKKVTMDLTPYIPNRLVISDEDGLVKECTFTMDKSLLMLDVLSIGMEIVVTGGDLITSENLFSGYIKSIEPVFTDSGDVELTIKCHSTEGKAMNVQSKDIIHPSNNHPKSWGKQNLTYTSIISNIAKDMGIIVNADNIHVSKEISATFKNPVKQHNSTDWAFVQKLARSMGATVWTEEVGGNSYLHLKEDNSLVTTVSPTTFFYLSRMPDGGFYNIEKTDNMIQLEKVAIKLDTENGTGAYKRRQTTDKKGNPVTQVYTDRPTKGDNKDEEENNSTERWVLDEEKLKGLSSEKRMELIELFIAGQVTWDGEDGGVAAKNYFKKVSSDESSRSEVPNNIQVQNTPPEKGVDSSGVTSKDSTTENTGSTSKTIKLDTEKIGKLSPEARSKVMGRIIRSEMTEEDKSLYAVIDTTPKADKEVKPPNAKQTQAGVDKKTKIKAPVSVPTNNSEPKRKRDEGFTITATVFGDLRIKGKKSYLIEGISKYSGLYYLYRITYTFGSSGFYMELTFTK